MKQEIEKIIKNGIVEQYSNSEWVTRLINSICEYIEKIPKDYCHICEKCLDNKPEIEKFGLKAGDNILPGAQKLLTNAMINKINELVEAANGQHNNTSQQ